MEKGKTEKKLIERWEIGHKRFLGGFVAYTGQREANALRKMRDMGLVELKSLSGWCKQRVQGGFHKTVYYPQGSYKIIS